MIYLPLRRKHYLRRHNPNQLIYHWHTLCDPHTTISRATIIDIRFLFPIPQFPMWLSLTYALYSPYHNFPRDYHWHTLCIPHTKRAGFPCSTCIQMPGFIVLFLLLESNSQTHIREWISQVAWIVCFWLENAMLLFRKELSLAVAYELTTCLVFKSFYLNYNCCM